MKGTAEEAPLLKVRKRRGITQERLAEKSGVSQEAISKLERRGPVVGVLHALRVARALDTTVEDLFGPFLEQPENPRSRRRVSTG